MSASENPKRKLDFDSKFISHSNTEPDIHGITVTRDGEILLCDVNNRCVLKYSNTGQYENSCKIGYYPRDVSTVPDSNQAAVTLQESRFSRKPGFIAFIDILSMKLVKEVQLESTPFGITCSANYLSLGSWNMIQSHDFKGALAKTIDLPDDRTAVKCLQTTHSGRLCYTSTTVNCITTDGNAVFKYEVKDGKPRGLCEGDDHFIFVSYSNGQLLRISENGDLDDIILRGDEGYGPLNAICFNKDYTKLYVVTNDGSSLSSFDYK